MGGESKTHKGKYKPLESKTHKGWFIPKGFEYFLVDKTGLLMNSKTKYKTRGSPDMNGYHRACVWDNATRTKKEYKVHVIVCTAFHGPKPSKLHEVGHEDDDRSNNHPNNLRWITRSENMIKANKKMWEKRKRTA